MRWKLIILTSLTAAVLYSVIIIGLVLASEFFEALFSIYEPNPLFVAVFVFAIISLLAAFYVYRRTSKWRKTQAALTITLTGITSSYILFTLLFLAFKLSRPISYL